MQQAVLYNQWLLWWNLTQIQSRSIYVLQIPVPPPKEQYDAVCQIVVAFSIDFVLAFLIILVLLVWNFHSYNLIVYFCKIMSKSYLLISKLFYVFTAHQIVKMKPNVILIQPIEVGLQKNKTIQKKTSFNIASKYVLDFHYFAWQFSSKWNVINTTA